MTNALLDRVRQPRRLGIAAIVSAIAAAVLSAVPVVGQLATYLLAEAVILVGFAAWMLGERMPGESAPESDDARWNRELAIHASSLVLVVIFLLLTMVELLAIPAALGHLVVFSSFGLAFISFYPILLGALVCALAGAILLADRGPVFPALKHRQYRLGVAAALMTLVFVVLAAAVGAGMFQPFGIRTERAIFVLAASLVSLFFFVKVWLRLPSYSEVSDWLERDERIRASGALRRIVNGLVAVAGLGVVLALLSLLSAIPRSVGMAGIGLAMLALLGATFNVGVSHVVPRLELSADAAANAAEARRKRRLVLGATSITLTGLGVAVGILTALAFLAQAGGVAIFHSLLEAYVAYYLAIFAVVLVPLGAAVLVRSRVKSELAYTPQLRALAIGGATLTLVLVFLAVFIGSGFAEGSGIQMENAVLVMGGAVLSLILFVKSRALLPGVVGLIREAIASSAHVDASDQESIKTRMIATYVAALVFILSFAGYLVATTLGVVEKPSSSLGTDMGVFVYLLVGIALLVVVVMRYFQSVNIDPRWATKEEAATIGKKRLTSDQVKRYLILGFSVGAASLLGVIGLLVTLGAIGSIGPFPVAKKYGTDFFVFAILLGLGPYGWYQAREAKRVEAIDAKFPEFLRDLAESQRAGMTLTEAVLTAAKGSYGMLTPEIRKMAAQIEWGIAFSDALERFAARVNTPLINRTVSLVVQASAAGGNVVDVLTAAADDSREIQQIVKERKQSMSIYLMIIYIAFAVFIGVIAVLNAQFIPEVSKAVSKADGVTIGGLKFRAFDQEEFKMVFFHAAVIQGFGGGIVGGVMAGGRPVHGLRHSFILVSIAWVLFRLVIG